MAEQPEPPRTDFDMYTPEGNQAVATMITGIIEEIRTGQLRRTELADRIQRGTAEMAKQYPEIYDTEPQGDIADTISGECEQQLWQPISRWDW
jgi:hypothetical protein